MTTHPNRSRPYGASNPTPEAVRAARESAGLTQTAAAELIYSTMRAWQDWESGARRMHPGLFELFGVKSQTLGADVCITAPAPPARPQYPESG